MEKAFEPKGAPAAGRVSHGSHKATARKWVRSLIWVYLALLVLEGALRKWVLPQFSDPLLVIRDPVAILIYGFALRAQIFPRNWFMVWLGVIAFLSWLTSIIILQPYLPPKTIFLVTAYGFRSDFLHLPLIFIIGTVFNADDIKKMGWWILVGLIPMALLMTMQFKASPESFINRTVGTGEGEQITAGGGKIRPPGTFSFITGVIGYLATAAAFLLHGFLSRTTYKTWLLAAAGFALVVSVAVSGSRAAVAIVALVTAALIVILILRPEAVNRFGRSLLLAVVLLWAVSYLPIFRQGLGILSDRFVDSAQVGDTTIASGMIERVFSDFAEGFRVFDRLPLFGYGLGIGTNAGAKFVTGSAGFLLAESEWARLLLECGSVLGLGFILWRVALTIRIGWLAIRGLGFGETLPLLLFSAGFMNLLNGQFGQPTTLGFAVLLSGLCLASTNLGDEADAPAPAPGEATRRTEKIPGRSPYATRLHGSNGGGTKSNGSFDR